MENKRGAKDGIITSLFDRLFYPYLRDKFNRPPKVLCLPFHSAFQRIPDRTGQSDGIYTDVPFRNHCPSFQLVLATFQKIGYRNMHYTFKSLETTNNCNNSATLFEENWYLMTRKLKKGRCILGRWCWIQIASSLVKR